MGVSWSEVRQRIWCGLLVGALVTILGMFAVATTAVGDPPGTSTVQGPVDTGLCGFPVQATLVDAQLPRSVGAHTQIAGFENTVVRNLATGQEASLNGSSPYSVDASGALNIRGHAIWVGVPSLLPFETTDGALTLLPDFALTTSSSNATVVDPCALVGPAPVLTPATTAAPWGLPANALSHIAYAGLIPNIGAFVRHDHVHLDMVINGQAATVPAGIGMAEPFDFGSCPPGFSDGDCSTGNLYDGLVAESTLHTHSTSGIIHIETDRPSPELTLGQFFDEWGVRLNQDCVGGYCTGNGKQLRVYVNGIQVTGDVRSLVLLNEQEIAVIYGGPGAFNSVPSTYTGGWPAGGCGGVGEPPC